jgi:hypothetical protein
VGTLLECTLPLGGHQIQRYRRTATLIKKVRQSRNATVSTAYP